jgi:hypothetical protein
VPPYVRGPLLNFNDGTENEERFMDLRAYYKKLRLIEAGLTGEEFVMVSLATPEGGKAGVLTEVPRAVAARLLAEGCAELATEEEAKAYREAVWEAKAKIDEEVAARQVQVMVIPVPPRRKQRG